MVKASSNHSYDCALVGSNNSARAGSLYGSLNPGEAFKRSYYCALISSNDIECAASLNGSLQSSLNGCLDVTTVQPHTVWGLALHSYFEYTRSHLEFTSMVSDLITFKAYFFAVPSEVFFRCQGTCVCKSVFPLKAYSICWFKVSNFQYWVVLPECNSWSVLLERWPD